MKTGDGVIIGKETTTTIHASAETTVFTRTGEMKVKREGTIKE